MGRLFAVALFLALLSCNSPDHKDDADTDSLTDLSKGSPDIVVETKKAAFKEFSYLINTNGKVRSLREHTYYSENNARVLVCKVKPGSLLKEGEVVVEFENTAVKLRIEKEDMNKFNAEKEYESQLLGYEKMLADFDSSRSFSIRKKLKVSSGLAGAEYDLKQSKYELSRSVIIAPFYCRAADVKIQEGEYSKVGMDLFKLYDPINLLLEVKMLESDIVLLNEKTLADVIPVSNRDLVYKASVFDVNPYIDADGMATVRWKIKGNMFLFPGMNCMAQIQIRNKRSIIVPKEAMLMRNGRSVVFTVSGGLAKWHDVMPGRENGVDIEILNGIQDGDEVIVTNNMQLAHDSHVIVTKK